MSYVYDTDGSLPDGKVDGVVTTTPSNKRAKATEWNSLCHAIADLRTALLAISPAAGEVAADTITPPITGGSADLSQPLVSAFTEPSNGVIAQRANFDATSNPAHSSPALANFEHPLELGGYTSDSDAGAAIYLGAMVAKIAGAVLTVLNNYGMPGGGSEIELLKIMANGDALVAGSVHVNSQLGTDGRIISDAGPFYLIANGGQFLEWSKAASGNTVEWYKGPGGTLVASLDATGNLRLGGQLTLDGGAGKLTGTFRADIDANFLYVDTHFRSQGNIYADGSITAQTTLSAPTIASPAAMTLNPGTTFAVHGQNFDVDTAGNVITTGKALVVGGIGVGNSAAASAPGTVVKKMEVFDAAGNSIGFVPIYDTIS